MAPEADVQDPKPDETDPDEGGTQTDDEGKTGSDVDDDAGDDSQSTTDDDSSDDDEGDTEGDDTGDEGEGDEGDGKPSGKKEAYTKLLAKYGGDEEKLAEGVWKQGNSLAKISKRLDSLQETLQQAMAPPEPDVAALVDEDPYVKEAANDLRSTDAAVKKAQKEQVQIIAEHGRLEKEVSRLEGALKAAPIEDRDEIREELREAKSDRKEAHREYRDSKREIGQLEDKLRESARGFRAAEQNAKARLDRERQQAQTRKEREATTRQDFTDAVIDEAERYGIPTDSATFKVLHQSVKDRITGFLRTLPKGSPGVNIPEAVEVLFEEYVEAMHLKSRFQKASTRKRKAGGSNKGSGITAPEVKGDKKGEWTADYVRKRAAQLLP
jgi:hypothetical protein